MERLYNRISRELLQKKMSEDETKRITLSFYKYARIGNPNFFRDHFYILMDRCNVLGRIYVAQEGVNGQISVPEKELDNFTKSMAEITFLENVRLNYAIENSSKSFIKLKIKVRNKIVADGIEDPNFNPSDRGEHLTATEFNELTSKDETVIVDMRNHYESEVGHFKDAITPDVETFRESLPIVEDMLENKKDKPIVMYCTGGIRCEKASAYLKHKGFEKVYQLDGGIIEYARQVELKGLENKFLGKNFVFDERLGERISGDIISKCHQCGEPCDSHINCKNDACHILFIQCKKCADKNKDCCSVKCQDFMELSEAKREELRGQIEFNGSRFGKGRYKAHRKDHSLE